MAEIEVCDVCGSTDIRQFKCKWVCKNCGAILKTCSDLTELLAVWSFLFSIEG
jgi:ribosomal protein L37AE/L43A